MSVTASHIKVIDEQIQLIKAVTTIKPLITNHSKTQICNAPFDQIVLYGYTRQDQMS
jgi:hypothetical protein